MQYTVHAVQLLHLCPAAWTPNISWAGVPAVTATNRMGLYMLHFCSCLARVILGHKRVVSALLDF